MNLSTSIGSGELALNGRWMNRSPAALAATADASISEPGSLARRRLMTDAYPSFLTSASAAGAVAPAHATVLPMYPKLTMPGTDVLVMPLWAAATTIVLRNSTPHTSELTLMICLLNKASSRCHPARRYRRCIHSSIFSPATSTTSVSVRAIRLVRQIPAPTASPTAATIQIAAAVVSPCTSCRSGLRMMTPPPMKPRPAVMPCRIRLVADASSAASRSPTIVKSAPPRATSACVRRPAGFPSHSRLSPTAAPSSVASARRPAISQIVWGGETVSIRSRRDLTPGTDPVRSFGPARSINTRHGRLVVVLLTTMRAVTGVAWSRQRIRQNVDHEVGMDINQHEIAIGEPILQLRRQRRQHPQERRPHRRSQFPGEPLVDRRGRHLRRALFVDEREYGLDRLSTPSESGLQTRTDQGADVGRQDHAAPGLATRRTDSCLHGLERVEDVFAVVERLRQ